MISNARKWSFKAETRGNISPFEVKRILRTVRYEPKTSELLPFLKKKRHVVRRLKFTQEHRAWPPSKRRNILWFDETKVVPFGSKDRCQYVGLIQHLDYRKIRGCKNKCMGLFLLLQALVLYFV